MKPKKTQPPLSKSPAAKSARRRPEKPFVETDERFRLLVQSVRDYAIFMLDPKGIVVTWNPGAERFKGYRAEEIVGKHFSIFYPEEAKKARKPEIELAIAIDEGRVEDEGWRLRKDGTRFWANVVITALRDEKGKLRGFAKVTRDLSERRAAEEALRRTNAELEGRVRERTEELLRINQGLQTSLADLERSNKALEQFAYVASHDLQEPLRKIMAFSDRLKEREIPGMSDLERDYLGRMQSAALRMKRLIDDLLNFSRVTTKEGPFQRLDLREVVTDALRDLETRVTQTGAVVEFGELPSVSADPMQASHLFQNILANAIKFARKGQPPRIRILASRAGARVEVRIEDEGIGFDEKYLDRIFKPFQRLHGRDEYEGTGIGLAICEKIVRRHGGLLTATSVPGKGSTFLFSFPAA